MSVNIKNPEAEALLKALADATGESLTQAAAGAFRERLTRVKEERAAAQGASLSSLLDLIAEARAQPQTEQPSIKQITDELWGDP